MDNDARSNENGVGGQNYIATTNGWLLIKSIYDLGLKSPATIDFSKEAAPYDLCYRHELVPLFGVVTRQGYFVNCTEHQMFHTLDKGPTRLTDIEVGDHIKIATLHNPPYGEVSDYNKEDIEPYKLLQANRVTQESALVKLIQDAKVLNDENGKPMLRFDNLFIYEGHPLSLLFLNLGVHVTHDIQSRSLLIDNDNLCTLQGKLPVIEGLRPSFTEIPQYDEVTYIRYIGPGNAYWCAAPEQIVNGLVLYGD